MTKNRTLVVVAAAVLLVAVLSLAGLGLEKVPEGQVAVVPDGDGGVARVLESGWSWRPPWSGDLLPLPREPVQARVEISPTTAEGASIVLDLAGSFAVESGREAEWVEAAGWRPFLEGVAAVAREAVEPSVRTADPAAVFEEGAVAALGDAARSALESAGVRVGALVAAAPVEKNPVAVAAIRNRVVALADPTGLKVMVVGWDGADWLMAGPLVEQGRLPNLSRLVQGGVSGDLRSQEPLLSPLVWTTIATGKSVEEHGIADFLVQDPETGSPVPISSASRKVHALWTLLPAFDMTSDVVAWWATWPAEKTLGTLVSDRVAYQLFDYEESDEAAGKVYPESAWPRVTEHLVGAEEVPWEEVQRFVDLPRQELEMRWNALPPERRQEDPVNHLRKIIATTRSYHAIALDLLEEQADLSLFYYEGTDTVGHLFARYLPPRMPGVTERDLAAFGETLPRFYEWADELLGELLERVDDDTVVMLVSDHGFYTGAARPEADPSDFTGGAPHWHRLHGVIAGDGPGIDRGTVDRASIFDLVPTILAILGLPVPEDMSGQVLRPLLPPKAREAGGGEGPVETTLASYEVLPRERASAVRVAGEDDEERLRELVALGYISAAALEERRGGDGGEAAGGAAPASPAATATATGTDLTGLATEAYNRGRIAQREGRLDEAERHFATALERTPSFGTAWASYAQIASARGDHATAFERLVRGFSSSGSMPRAAITGLVDEARAAGRLDAAAQVLEQLRPARGDDSAYHAAVGLLRESRGDVPGALEAYRQALSIDPLDELSVEQTVVLLRRQGREGEARSFLAERAGMASSVSAMNQLAVVALRQRWPAEAERLLARVLESDPGNPGVLSNLAAAQAQQGKMAEASTTMSEALERQPNNARNHFNLGAMLAAQGRTVEALEAFRRAIDLGLATPEVHVAAAKMAFRLGDPAAAERQLEQALALNPGHAEARELLTVLRTGG